MKYILLIVLLAYAGSFNCLKAMGDILLMDFEGDSYGDWIVEGDAFGDKPTAKGNQMFPFFSGYKGAAFVQTYVDRKYEPTGTLTSPEFRIERDFINMRIAGGPDGGRLGVKVMVDGVEVGRVGATKGNHLDETSISVSDHKGKKARVVIFDKSKDWWGYIAVDQILQSDTKVGYEGKELSFNVTHNLLLIPCAKGGVARRLEIFDDKGILLHTVTVSLAATEQAIAFWSYLDLSDVKGRNVKVTLSAKLGSDTVKLFELADEPRSLLPPYDEKYRPQFHFSQLKGWNNDPNGMVYYEGRYHLFWQCNPVGTGWGNMYWGHASSPDMVNWTEHKRALRSGAGRGVPLEKRHTSMATGACFSGGGNVDHTNATGLNIGDKKTMLLFNSDMNAGVSIFYSHDGLNFHRWMEKYPMGISGRDAKVVYHEPTQQWVAVSVVDDKGKKFGRYFPVHTSKDLKNWTLTQNFTDVHECPEFFELPVDGDNHNKKWVMMEASSEYFVGEFNGEQFVPDHTKKKVTMIPRSSYAGQCFSNSPDGRAVYIGWAGIVTEGMPFNQGFSIPMNLTLRTIKDGSVHLFANPIKELETLRESAKIEATGIVLNAGNSSYRENLDGELYDISFTLRKKGNPKTATVQIEKMKWVYDFAKEQFGRMPAPMKDGKVTVRILVDRPTMEVFVADGYSYYMEQRKNLSGNILGEITINADAPSGSSVIVDDVKIYPMKSIWKESKK